MQKLGNCKLSDKKIRLVRFAICRSLINRFTNVSTWVRLPSVSELFPTAQNHFMCTSSHTNDELVINEKNVITFSNDKSNSGANVYVSFTHRQIFGTFWPVSDFQTLMHL